MREATDPSIVYVTDLVTCSNKREFRLKYPLLAFKFEPQLIIGDLVHKGLESLLSSRGWEVEVSVEKSIDVDGKMYRVLGRVDLLKRDDNGNIVDVVEVKTVRELVDRFPLEHHLLQLRVYLELLEANRGRILYVSRNRIVEYEVERGEISIESMVRETIYNTAIPRYSWECRYCTYKKICPYAAQEEHSSSS